MSAELATTNEIGSLGFVQIPIPVLLDPDLTPPQKLLYAVLKRFTMNGSTCFPGVDRLSKATDSTDRTVQRNMDALIKRGLVVRKIRTGSTNLYLVMEPEDVYAEKETRRLSVETISFLRKAGEDKTVDKLLKIREVLDDAFDSAIESCDRSDFDSNNVDDIDDSLKGTSVSGEENICSTVNKVPAGVRSYDDVLKNMDNRLLRSKTASDKRKTKKNLRASKPPSVVEDPGPEYIGGEPMEEDKPKFKVLESEWRRVMREMWPNEPGITPPWTPKQFGIAKNVVNRFMEDGVDWRDTFWAFLEVVRKWKEISSDFGIKDYPKVQLVAGYSDTWFPRVWGARQIGGGVSKREAARKKRGYDERGATAAEREGGITII